MTCPNSSSKQLEELMFGPNQLAPVWVWHLDRDRDYQDVRLVVRKLWLYSILICHVIPSVGMEGFILGWAVLLACVLSLTLGIFSDTNFPLFNAFSALWIFFTLACLHLPMFYLVSTFLAWISGCPLISHTYLKAETSSYFCPQINNLRNLLRCYC